MNKRKIIEFDVEEALRLKRLGHSDKYVGEQLGVSHQTVYSRLFDYKNKIVETGNYPVGEIVKLVEAGHKTSSIARTLSVPYNVALYYVSKYRTLEKEGKRLVVKLPAKPKIVQEEKIETFSELEKRLVYLRERLLSMAVKVDEAMSGLKVLNQLEDLVNKTVDLKSQFDTVTAEKNRLQAKIIEQAMIVYGSK